MTELLKEDWLDNELKKIQHVWMKKGPDGKFLWDKRRKMNWIDNMDVKAGRYDVSDYELEQAMADYGIGYNLKWYNKDGSYTKEGEKQGLLDVSEESKVNKDQEEAEKMNQYVTMLQKERNVNLWAEAKRVFNFPPPVDGKKTLTGKPQQKATVNPKEKGV